MKADYSSTACNTNNDNDTETPVLQIDCSLAISTSVSSAFTTPSNSDSMSDNFIDDQANAEKWESFYENVDKTPPKATRTTSYDQAFEMAASLLRLSELEEFKNGSVDSLTPDQQAMLIFMIVKDMLEVFPSRFIAAQAITKALCPDAPEYKRILCFVRQGGDRKLPRQRNLDRSYASFIAKNSSWDIDEAKTIFNAKDNKGMEPFILHQLEGPYICSYTACSALLYYSSYKKLEKGKRNKLEKRQEEDTAAKAFKVNISRFVRDEISGSEIANITLTDVKGAHLRRVLLGMLKSFGASDDEEVEVIPTFQKEDLMFMWFQAYLEEGRPFVFGIEAFPSLLNRKFREYSGKVSDCMNMRDRETDPVKRRYHAVVCVGIKPREGDTPPMLLVQDSCGYRPFYAVGMDLLMDMGLQNLQFSTVSTTWCFRQNLDYVVDPSMKHLLCGSPMSFKDGVARLVPHPKEPVKPNPDMSRYFEWVDPTQGEIHVEV